ETQNLEDELVRGADALLEAEVRIGLGEDVEPVREPAVVAAEARMMRVGHPSFAIAPLVLDEVAVEERLEAGAPPQALAHDGQESMAAVDDRLAARRPPPVRRGRGQRCARGRY